LETLVFGIQPVCFAGNNGMYYRGNMDLLPNPSDRVVLKFGLFKKYLSARYMFTDQDYWNKFVEEDGKTISVSENFKGKVEKFYLFANTNQNLFKNKLNVNLESVGIILITAISIEKMD
jgi:hypothetical protein